MAILSRKVRYALHGLAFLAVHPNKRPVPFNEILRFLRTYSDQLTLSNGYIAKIFQEVSRAGFAAAMPGPRGGYQLAKPGDEIRLLDVVRALDGPPVPECCLLSVGRCPRQENCGFRQVIERAEDAFYSELEKETVASIAARMEFGEIVPPAPSHPAEQRPQAPDPLNGTLAKAL
jgi:Rrf2 family protein